MNAKQTNQDQGKRSTASHTHSDTMYAVQVGTENKRLVMPRLNGQSLFFWRSSAVQLKRDLQKSGIRTARVVRVHVTYTWESP